MNNKNYSGTSISWYGDIPAEWNGNSTTGTWVVDNNPSQVFVLKGHGTNAVTQYNQKFFETPVYPYGSHTLTVTYNGDSAKTPLVLGYLAIQNTTVPNSTAGGSTATGTTSAGSTAAADSMVSGPVAKSNTPAIVGGVIGGVACLVALVLLVMYRRSRRQREDKETRFTEVQEPLEYGSESPARGMQNVIPSRLPAKALEVGFSTRSQYAGSAGLPTNASEAATDSAGGTSATAESNPGFVVHQDSGARIPHAPLLDIPPLYTPD